jgi:hypothetical protein
MTDAYWDDLGVVWRATIPDVEALTIRLRARHRRVLIAQGVAIAISAAMAAVGLALGFWWISEGISEGGHFRPLATGLLCVVSVIAAVAISVWQRGRPRGDEENLSNMIERAIYHEEAASRTRSAVYMVSGFLALFVAAMWVVHPAIDTAPADVVRQRLLTSSAFAAVWAVGWTIWAIGRRRRALRNLAGLRHIKELLKGRE